MIFHFPIPSLLWLDESCRGSCHSVCAHKRRNSVSYAWALYWCSALWYSVAGNMAASLLRGVSGWGWGFVIFKTRLVKTLNLSLSLFPSFSLLSLSLSLSLFSLSLSLSLCVFLTETLCICPLFVWGHCHTSVWWPEADTRTHTHTHKHTHKHTHTYTILLF